MKRAKIRISVTPKDARLATRINRELKELLLETLKEEGTNFTAWLEEKIIEYLKEKGKIEIRTGG